MIATTDQQLALELRSRIVAQGISIHKFIVYGSRARGDAREDSDLDILVIVDGPERDAQSSIWHLAWELGLDEDRLISAQVMSRHEAEETPQRSSLFMMNIRSEGIVL